MTGVTGETGETGESGSLPWRAIAGGDQLAAALLDLYATRGADRFEESVTQLAHAVQSAELAGAAGADDPLVAAALLHDIGHLLAPGRGADRDLRHARDLRHEDVGARFLARWYGPEVTEPIRLHVAAKRFLCAVEPDYAAGLSPASVRSLALQGGPMTPAEAAEFERLPDHAAAATLRRWDDRAKDPDRPGPPLRSFAPLLAGLARFPD